MHRQEQRPSSAALTPRLQGGRLPGDKGRGTRGAAWVSPAGLRPEVGLSQESQSRPACKPSIYIQVRSSEGRGQRGMNHLFVQNMTQLSPQAASSAREGRVDGEALGSHLLARPLSARGSPPRLGFPSLPGAGPRAAPLSWVLAGPPRLQGPSPASSTEQGCAV